MFYDRKIKYLDYLENGQRVRNGGFVKLEAREDNCYITIQITGPCEMELQNCKVYFCVGERKEQFCEFTLSQGKGSVHKCVNCGDLCGGIAYEQLEAISIPIAVGRELCCVIGEREWDSRKKEVLEAEDSGEGEAPEAPVLQKEVPEAGNWEKNVVSEVEIQDLQEKQIQKAPLKSAKPPQENKWNQLSAIYPHIRPFRDDREYLSIGPGDFVILSAKSYQLVGNSFLLHGFYNYKHLILTRVETKGENRYYIGVPGNFYDREKQVAVMFGFESFECAEEPAEVGEFGYYMVRVEL